MQERPLSFRQAELEIDPSSLIRGDESRTTVCWCGMGGVFSRVRRRRRSIRRRGSRHGSHSLRCENQQNELTLLVLGASEAGKSTFIKQLRLVHGDGYSERERASLRHVARSLLYTGIQTLLLGLEELGEQLPGESCVQATTIKGISLMDLANVLESESALPKEHVDALERLWSEPVVKACFRQRFDLTSRGYTVPESCGYFLDNLARVGGDGYTPTIEDVLRVRLPTTGIQEYVFDVEKQLFRVYDVGGQRSERRKWIHRFEGTNAIIFITAISEFDQMLEEDRTTNRLMESLALFKTIISYPPLQSSTIVLFLNKTDLFAERLQHSNLSKFFPDYKGPPHDVTKAGTFVLNMFGEIGSSADRIIYAHFTCATDTENMRVVFDAVKDSIIHDSLRQANLIC